MPFDVGRAAESLADAVNVARQVPPGGWPTGVPARELWRSPAASRVGNLAAAAGLGLHHTEWRHQLGLPASWVPEHDPELAERPAWAGGVLPEAKYQAFRHDQALGGFHPGMRAKWGAHELCHGLVGFAWRPGASPLFVATASRLAEMVPVVLWYWLDEVHLARCPYHTTSGAVHRALCPACERLAEPRIADAQAEPTLERAREFVEAELAAIRRTRREGWPIPNLYGSIDLCSDGIAYAAAHGPRVRSEMFDRYVHDYLEAGGGWLTDLDALEARVMEVLRGIAEGAPVAPLAPTRTHGEIRWVLQDLGWRLLALAEDTEGEAREVLVGLSTAMGAVARRTFDPAESAERLRADGASAVQRALRGYADLHDDYEIPSPDEVFSLGFDLLGVAAGRSASQVEAGVRSALPLTADLLGRSFPELIGTFLAQDHPVRAPLGRRFASWLAGIADRPIADLARYEAELAALPANENEVVGLAGSAVAAEVRLSEGARVLLCEVDVVEMAKAASFGDIVVVGTEARDVDGAAIPVQPSAYVLVRAASGDPQVLDVGAEVGGKLLSLWDGGTLDVSDGVQRSLIAAGALAPVRWPIE